MAILHADERPFIGPYKKPRWAVGGNEEGSPFRRVYRSEGQARRFFNRMKERPRISLLYIVEYPNE